MSLREIETENRRELIEYIIDNWPDIDNISLFMEALLDEGNLFAIEAIEKMGRHARDKWNNGTNYEDSIAEASARITNNMRREMADMFDFGVTEKEAAEYLGERFYATRVHDLSRIIVTEHTRIEAAEVLERGDRYIYHCVHDGKTCEECLMRDGQVYLSSDANFGVNCPPMHPWCRCWLTNE